MHNTSLSSCLSVDEEESCLERSYLDPKSSIQGTERHQVYLIYYDIYISLILRSVTPDLGLRLQESLTLFVMMSTHQFTYLLPVWLLQVFDSDDILAQTPASYGELFMLTGHESEIGDIEPYVEVIHYCKVSTKN